MASAALLWPWARTTLGREWGSCWWDGRAYQRFKLRTLVGKYGELTLPLLPTATPQGLARPSGALAELPGTRQHDYVLHRHPWPLSRQRDHQLPHSYLLVHAAGLSVCPSVTQGLHEGRWVMGFCGCC